MNVYDSNFVYFFHYHTLYVLKNGLNNSFQALPFAAGPYAVSFTDALNGLSAGFGDTVYRTTNGGVNWQTASVLPSGTFTLSVTAVPNTQWYLLSGTHYMALTYNSGISFFDPLFFTDLSVGFSHAVDTNSFWVPSNNGLMFKYDFSYIGIKQISQSVPEHFTLHQNYPNPFNPETRIIFELPKPSSVLFEVFDISGKIVYTQNDIVKKGGKFELTFDGSNLASGVYFYRLTAGNNIQSKKMALIK